MELSGSAGRVCGIGISLSEIEQEKDRDRYEEHQSQTIKQSGPAVVIRQRNQDEDITGTEKKPQEAGVYFSLFGFRRALCNGGESHIPGGHHVQSRYGSRLPVPDPSAYGCLLYGFHG